MKELIFSFFFLLTVININFSQDINKEGFLLDKRDGKKYKTIVIDNKIWTVENMNYVVPESSDWHKSKCPEDNQSSCNEYGQLYRFDITKKVCPSGWHLPTDDDWIELTNFYEGIFDSNYEVKTLVEGKKINQKQAGFRTVHYFKRLKDQASYFWSSTSSKKYPTKAIIRKMFDNKIIRTSIDNGSYLSVRCVCDSTLSKKPNTIYEKEKAIIKEYSQKSQLSQIEFDGFYIQKKSGAFSEVLGSESQKCTFIKDVISTSISERANGEKKWFTLNKQITQVNSIEKIILKGNDFSDANLANAEWVKINQLDLSKSGFICRNEIFQNRGISYVVDSRQDVNQKLKITLRGKRENSTTYSLINSGQIAEGIYALLINGKLYCFQIIQ